MDHFNVSYMNSIRIFNWRTTDEDRIDQNIFRAPTNF